MSKLGKQETTNISMKKTPEKKPKTKQLHKGNASAFNK